MDHSIDVSVNPCQIGKDLCTYYTSNFTILDSSVVFLAMINMYPDDKTCIFSMLEYICKLSSKYNVPPVVTSDQPRLFQRFSDVLHVIRRTNQYSAGLVSDMVIEQTLMRSVKCTDGLTRGSSMTEQQRAIWTMTAPVSSEYNYANTRRQLPHEWREGQGRLGKTCHQA